MSMYKAYSSFQHCTSFSNPDRTNCTLILSILQLSCNNLCLKDNCQGAQALPSRQMCFILTWCPAINLLENMVLCYSSPDNPTTSKFTAASVYWVMSILFCASTSVQFDCAILSARVKFASQTPFYS